MKKAELLARIEMLERRIALLEARPHVAPSLVQQFQPPQFVSPTVVHPSIWPGYPHVTCGVAELSAVAGQACGSFGPMGIGAASAQSQ